MVEALNHVSSSIVEPQALDTQGNSVDPTAVQAGKAGLARNDLALFEKVYGEAGAKLGKSDVIVSAGASSQSPTYHCPSCGSSRVFHDGFRKASLNALSSEPIQRFRCAEYGHRWSEHIALNVIDNNKQINRISAKILQDAKNLVTTTKYKIVAEKERHSPTENEIKASPQIEKFLIQLENDGRKPGTTLNYRKSFKRLLDANADLLNPESCKATLAKLMVKDVKTKKSTETPVRDSTKISMVSMLDNWFNFNGILWKKPKYTDEAQIPYIPTEAELDQLIAGLGNKLSVFCQMLKDTGARCGEIARLTWADIDFGQRRVSIKAEKGSNNRVLPLTSKTIDMIANLPRDKERLFVNSENMRGNFFGQKKRIAKQLANPNIDKIHWHTFRFWKATTEAHRTKDPWYVKMILGHKSLKTTDRYVQLEKMLYLETSDEFIVKVADTMEEAIKLMEVGFDYHAEVEGHKLFRKRK